MDDAADLERYKLLVDEGDTDPHSYDRLMIHYRKEKQYAEELKLLKKALAMLARQLKKSQQDAWKNHNNVKVRKISRLISRQTGLTDKKGNELYTPEPFDRWTKRMATVEEKIKKQKRTKKR